MWTVCHLADNRERMAPEYGETCPTDDHGNPADAVRPWLMVWFRCVAKYQRVYRAADGTRYDARCPSCGKAVRFAVGPEGTGSRSFEVDCTR